MRRNTYLMSVVEFPRPRRPGAEFLEEVSPPPGFELHDALPIDGGRAVLLIFGRSVVEPTTGTLTFS